MNRTIIVFVALLSLFSFLPNSYCFAENNLPAADLSLIKTVDNPTPQIGQSVTFNVIVENDGPLDATAIVVKAYVKNGYSNVHNISDGGSLSGDTITWNLAQLLDNQTKTLNYSVVVNAPTNDIDYDNTAEIFSLAEYDRDSTPGNGPDPDGDGLIGPLDTNPNDGSIDPNGEDDSDNEPVHPEYIDLSLIKTVSHSMAYIGDIVSFSIEVINDGPSNATGIEVLDNLPSGFENIANISNGGLLNIDEINWSGITLNNGDTITLSFDAEVMDADDYVNIAEISAADQTDIDSTPGNGADTDGDGQIGPLDDDGSQDDDDEDDGDDAVVIPLRIDLQLVKTVSNPTPNVGEEITFTVTVSNVTDYDATGIEVTDIVPDGYSNINNISHSGILTVNSIEWVGITIPANTSLDLNFTVEVLAPLGVNYINTAEITGADQPDIDSTPGNGADTDGDGFIGLIDNDSSQDDDDEDDGDDAQVTPKVIDLSLIKTVNKSFANLGDEVIFTISVNNEGPADATDVSILDVVPNGYNNLTINNGGIAIANLITWTVPIITAGETIDLTFSATVINGSNYVNIAEVSAANEWDIDSTPGNGADTDDDGDIGPLDNDGSQDADDEDDGDDAEVSLCDLIAEISEVDPICANACTFLSVSVSNQSGNIIIEWSDDLGSDQTVQVCPSASTNYSVTVTDERGCVGTAMVVVNIKCEFGPELSINGGSSTFDCAGLPDFGTLNVNSECEINSENFEDVTNSNDCPYTITRKWTVIDECDNTVSIERTVTSTDANPPEFQNVPADLTVSCIGDIPGRQDVSAIDNCDPMVSLDFEQSTIPDCSNGSVTNTWTATDCYGNVNTATQVVIILDDQAPSFDQSPEDLTVNCDEIPSLAIITVSDNCETGIVPILSENIQDLACANEKLITRTWTATDCNGNTAELIQQITTKDDQAPVIEDLGPDGEYNCGEQPLFLEPNALDNCGVASLTFEDNTTDGFCGPIVTRTWTATDECGNASTAIQAMSQVDNIPPVIENIQNGTYDCDLSPVFIEPGVTDNCSETSISFIDDLGPEGCGGQDHIRTWIASDKCGNTSSVIQVLSPIDNNDPTISGVGDDGIYACEDAPIFSTPTVEDLCSNATIDFVDIFVMGSCTGSGTARLWTATDACGNTSTAMQTMIPQDLLAPEIIGVGDDGNFDCGTLAVFSEPTALDNCAEASLTFENSFGADNCAGTTLIRTWTATDDCGNSATAAQTLTPQDIEVPTILGVGNDGEYLCGDEPMFSDATAEDNCAIPTLVFEDTEGAISCAGIETIRTWTATDDCGNVSTATQVMTPLDFSPPEIVGVNPDGEYACGTTIQFSEPSTSDNCSNATLSFIDEDLQIGCAGAVVRRTWTATDDCGNRTTASQTMTGVDTQAPQILGVGNDGNFDCGQSPVFSNVTAEDNCTTPTLNFEDETIIDNCLITITRTWTATDACGNSATASQTMDSNDTVAPVLSNAGVDGTYDCGDLAEFTEPDVFDCNSFTLTSNDEVIPGGCAGEIIKRTWTAIDACGNSAEVSQTLEPVDTESPVFNALEEEIVFECGEPFVFVTPTATDNCGVIILTYVQDPGSKTCTPDGVIRTWTATDECGNTATIRQTLTPIDTVPPVFSGVGPGGIIECGVMPPFSMPTADDKCSFANLSFMDSRIEIDCDNWSITRTWTAIDGCSNESTVSETFVIVDTTPPTVASVEDEITINCTNSLSFPDLDASDDCGEVTITFVDLLGPEKCAGNDIFRTWTVTDACGNSTTVEQTLRKTDNTPPTFSSSGVDGTYECGETPIFTEPIANDICSEVTLIFEDTPTVGNCAGGGITRTWTATDECGNSASVSQTLESTDNTPPVDPMLMDFEYDCNDTPVFDDIEPIDNCSAVNLVFEDAVSPGSCAGLGTTRTWTATDICGNILVISQTATPVDNQAPFISGVGNDGEFFCGGTPTFSQPTATDNCSMATLTFADSPTTGNCVMGGITRTWTAIDECGNVSTETQTMEPIDFESPVLIGIGNDGEYACGSNPIFSDPTATDNCSSVTISFKDTPTVGNCAGPGTKRTWKALDACGNTTIGTQTMEPVDIIAPVFSGVVMPGTFLCGTEPDFSDPSATDNCTTADITFIDSPTAGNCAGAGITRTWTATDICGNTSTAWQTMEPFDDVDPIITVSNPVTQIECGNNQGFCDAYNLSTVIINLDDCAAVVNNNTHTDYSEFTGIHNNAPNAPEISNGNLFRLAPNVNTHSCAPGINGTPGMCVDIYAECTYQPGNQKAIVIEMDVDAATNGTSILSGISFFENAPSDFQFLNGPAGPNNYPTRYGMRILLDDVEVYSILDLPTSDGYSFENFLLGDQNISFSGISHFKIEILPYCPIMNGAEMSVWDVEHFVISFVSSDSILNYCVEANDNCSMVNLDYEDSNEGSGCAGEDIIRVWTATDACGNTATATQMLMLTDTQGPIIIGVGGNGVYNCGETAVFSEPTTFDLCGNASLSFVDEHDARTTTRTWTAIDDCGNTTVVSQTLKEVNCLIDLELDKSANITSGIIGDKVTFRIEVFNNSGLTANEVIALDKISTSFDLISHDLSQGIYNPISGLWTIGSIESLETVWLEIDAWIIHGPNHINQASIVSALEDDWDSQPNNRIDTNLNGDFTDDPGDEDDGDGVVLDINDFYNIKIYPQPIVNDAVLEIYNHSDALIGWELYTNSGQLLDRTSSELMTQGVHKFNLDVEDLNSGSYILKVNFGNRRITKKIIVIK